MLITVIESRGKRKCKHWTRQSFESRLDHEGQGSSESESKDEHTAAYVPRLNDAARQNQSQTLVESNCRLYKILAHTQTPRFSTI